VTATVSVPDRAQPIKLLLLDVDGVLTDGRIIYTDAGQELKFFHVRDGHGIKLIQRAGIEVAWVSGRASPVVALRARELGVDLLFQGVRNKVEVLRQLRASLNLTNPQIAAVGDDLVDLPLFSRVGLAVAVADAPPQVKEAAHWVTDTPGGRGAVREVCDLLLQAQDLWETLMAPYCV